MSDSEPQCSDKESEAGNNESQLKIKRTVESMIDQMKLTDEEINYRMENFDNVDVVKEYVKYLKCTKCGTNFKNLIRKGKKVGIHPLLGVLMCDACCDYYGDGNFSLDSDGEDKYCRWCGEGGSIFACSKCICGFCNKCIKTHFGDDGLKKVENDDDWVCYFCNPQPLWYLRSISALAEQASKTKCEDLNKKKEIDLTELNDDKNCEGDKTSSESQSDSEDEFLIKTLKRIKRKKLKKKRNSVNDRSKRDSSSSLEENQFNKSKSKRKSFQRLEKNHINDRNSKEDSTGSESRFPKKKAKVSEGPTEKLGNEDEERESDEKFKVKKNLVLEKLRGIWKLTQIVADVGLNSSKERLKLLSEGNNFKTMVSLQKECRKLESLTAAMLSSLNTTRSSIEFVTSDLNFENGPNSSSDRVVAQISSRLKDETDIFRSQETILKSVAKKLQEESDVDKKSDKPENSSSEVDDAEKRQIKRKSRRKNTKVNGSNAKSNDSNENKSDLSSEDEKQIEKSKSLFSDRESDGEKQNDNKSSENVGDDEKVNGSEECKPMLKVKSFARMLDENVYNVDGKDDDVVIVQETNLKKKPEQKEEEYNADTDDDVFEKKRSRRKNKNSSGSNFSEEEETVRSATKKIKNERKKMLKSFEKFREILKSKKEVKPKETEPEKQKEEKTEEKKRESSDDDMSDTKEKEVIKKRPKKMIITSSDEEKDKKEEEKKSDGSVKSDAEQEEKDTQNDELDSDKKVSPKVSSCETSSDDMQGKRSKYKRKKKKKKDASSSSSEDSDKDDKKKKGRRNIKRILKKDSLHVETKEALKNEDERRKRVEAKQKRLQELFPEEKNEDGSLKQLVLDFDPDTKEPLVSVHKKLVKKLKPHQVMGIKFMYDNCFESVQRLDEDSGSGCILAHCMGLGKTLQVITLVHTIMSHDLGVNTVLIVCPLSTVKNWISEFEMWLSNIHTDPITLYEITKYKRVDERCFYLKNWHEGGGVLVISYDLFRNLTKELTGKKKKKAKTKTKALQTFEAALVNPGPDLVVCDEGHLLKNEDTALSKCMNLVKTARRVILTGTPLQNNLIEYHCMVQFVKPNILGTKKEFSNRFVNPINNGQFEDSTEMDVKIMKRRSHVLHSMLKGCVQRFDYSVLTPFLPEKHEYVLSICLTDTQAKVYRHFIDTLSGRASGDKTKTAKLFNDYHNLQRIWTHPRTLLMHEDRESQKFDDDSEGSLKDFVVDSDESVSEPLSSDVEEIVPKKRILRSNANDPDIQKEIEEEEKMMNKRWWDDFYGENDYDDMKASNKLVVLFALLKHCGEAKDKVLVFSQSLYSLDLIEYFLKKIDENSGKDKENEQVCEHKDSWVLGIDYFRLDGSTNSENRAIWCKHFNKESNTRARLFLISTRAGGLGINLFGANRVVIFDASWNPSHDLQSIFRVYRFGQKKTCYIYRFLAEATMEEKIYERQVTKLSLAHRVVDEYQIERHYSMMNLQELYSYEPTPPEKRKVPKLPKDTLFADLLEAHKDKIVGYHEHDSLLENQEEEELSEEERKAAWEEYKNEKVQKVSAQFDPVLFQKQLQMAAIAHGHVVGPETMMQFNPQANSMLMNPIFMNQMAPQTFVNPMFANTSIPLPLLQRGLQLGLTPNFNETTESFFNRLKVREQFAHSMRET